MRTLTITESKAQLSALVERVVRTGEPITIGRAGTPMVQLVPYKPAPAGARLGGFAGRIRILPGFDQWDTEERSALGLDDRAP